MTVVQRLLKECGCLLEGKDFHFVGARQMHLQRYCDLARLVRSHALLSEASQRIAGAYSTSDAGVVATISPLDRQLAEAIAAQLTVVSGTNVTVQSLNSLLASGASDDRVLVVDTFCDETADTRKGLITLQKQRPVVGVCSVVATDAVNAVLLGVSKFVAVHKLGGSVFDAWGCARTGFCSREVPIVTEIGGSDAYVREHPYCKVVRLSAARNSMAACE